MTTTSVLGAIDTFGTLSPRLSKLAKLVASLASPKTKTSLSPACRLASRARAGHRGTVIRQLAPASASSSPSSRAVYKGVTDVDIAPSIATAFRTAGHRERVG